METDQQSHTISNNSVNSSDGVPNDPSNDQDLQTLIGGLRRRIAPGKGLSIVTACVFIVGEVAGGGILSLPFAVKGAGWAGIALIVVCCFNAGAAGICLAKSWLILEERYPEYKTGLTRKPFATIGYRAYGKWMSITVSVAMNVTRFGTSTVFLLLTSGLLKTVMQNFTDVNGLIWASRLGICSWVPIVGIALTPLMWLGSPADFWPAAYSAMISTVVGSILLLIDIIIESSDHVKTATYSAPSFKSFFLSFGNILFAFGGASAFPNFQNDMKEKEKFPKAVTYGFIGLLLLYIPVSAGGYAVYGDDVSRNIIEGMKANALLTTIEVCFVIHCFFAFLIIINPVLLEIEELIQIPKNFNWKRCTFRTALMVALIFTAETVPSFGRILDLIGGSTVTLMAFIMPPAFYFKLCSEKSERWPQRNIPLYHKLVLIQIAIIGVIGGIASTYSSIDSFVNPDSSLETPCYAGHHSNTSDIYFYK